ncbi:MAG: 2-oxo acid dehydrogenase subunit E2, partial [Thermoguttaceae bacterium]
MADTSPVVVPEIGESIFEVVIVQWHKQPGEPVSKDENLVELETDKATVELPSPASGKVAEILKGEGQSAKVGEIIGYLEVSGASGPESPLQAGSEATDRAPAAKEPPPTRRDESPSGGSPPADADTAERAGPRPAPQASLPEEPETSPRGSPPSPETPPAAASALRREEMRPMSPIRQRIARRLVAAHQAAALVTTFNEIDMSAVIALREQYGEAFREQHDAKLGFMSFFVKATIEGLKRVPELNAEIRGSEIAYRHYHDIGIAIGGGKALVVPVLRGAGQMRFAEIERAIADFAARARDNKLTPAELEDGTFTITNGGVYGSLLS